MKECLDKSILIAEIERKRDICEKVILDLRTKENKDYYQGKAEAYKETLDLLDTLKAKEVDLKKEINGYFKGWGDNEVGCFAMMQDGTSVGVEDCIDIAKHFFELGIKAQKGE